MNWKITVRVCVFICFALSVAALTTTVLLSRKLIIQVNDLHTKNVKLENKLFDQRLVADETTEELERSLNIIGSYQRITDTRLDGAEAKIDVLDSSMHPDKKRRQRVLRTRDAILEQLHGGKSMKICGNLSPDAVYRMAGWYVQYTDRYGIDLSLALAVGKSESAFCQKAVSKAGAVGIMQVMDDTADHLARRIGVRLSRYKTQDSIRMGVYYLAQLLLDFQGDTELAVKSYNMGPHNVKKVLAGEIENYFRETREYWYRVQQHQKDFKEAGL